MCLVTTPLLAFLPPTDIDLTVKAGREAAESESPIITNDRWTQGESRESLTTSRGHCCRYRHACVIVRVESTQPYGWCKREREEEEEEEEEEKEAEGERRIT